MYCRNLVYLSVECGGLFEDETGSVEITDLDGYGNIPATGHKAGTAWKSDGNSHWNECENCGNKMNEAVHTFEWVKDKDGSRHETCTVCGYVKNVRSKDGRHKYSSESCENRRRQQRIIPVALPTGSVRHCADWNHYLQKKR